MEGVPRMPMLGIELKQNSFDYSSLDWAGMPTEDIHEATQQQIIDGLKKHIKEEYGDDPEKYTGAIEKLIEIQTASYKAILSPDFEGCNTLKKYYGQLHYMQSRFPFTGGDQVKVTFTWQDAFTGILTVHESFSFEQTAILFNIGAIHSLLGEMDSRTTEEGIRISCVHFQCAAGLFTYISEHFDTTLSPDISQAMLKLFINVMLAQGQECLLEKSMQDNRKHSIVSKISQQVVEYYKQTQQCLENRETENNLGSNAYKHWKRIVIFKAAYYSAITKYYMGNNSLDQDKYGQAVSFYGSAVKSLNDSAKLSKNIQKETRLKIEEALKFTSDVLNGNAIILLLAYNGRPKFDVSVKQKEALQMQKLYNSSVRDNNFVYNDKVPDPSALPEIKGASLVKPLPFEPANESLTGPDIFAKLVPMKAHLAASTYSDEKDKLLRKVNEGIDEKDETLKQYKQSIELDPKKLINYTETSKLDQALLEKCALFSVDQTPITQLKQATEELTDVYTELDSVLNNILSITEDEETEDIKLKDTAGKEAFSTEDDVEGIKKELGVYKEIYHKSTQMNEDLHTACRIHIANMKLIAGGMDSLKEELSLINIADLLSNEEKSDVESMRKLCDKVVEMEEQRQNLMRQLKQGLESDDVTATLVTKHGVDQEDLFQEELKKHDSIITTINQNLSAQDNILGAVTQANARYAKIRKTVETERDRVEQKVGNLLLSCDVQEEVLKKCNEGKKFFLEILDKAKQLYDRANDFHEENESKRKAIYKKIEEREKAKHPPPRPSAPKPKLSPKKPAAATPKLPATTMAPIGPGMVLSPDVLAKMMADDDDELLNDPAFLQFLQNQGDLQSMDYAASLPGVNTAKPPSTGISNVSSRPHSMPPTSYTPSNYPVVSSPHGVQGYVKFDHRNAPSRPHPQPTPPHVGQPYQHTFDQSRPTPQPTPPQTGVAYQQSFVQRPNVSASPQVFNQSNMPDPRQSPGPAGMIYSPQPATGPLPRQQFHQQDTRNSHYAISVGQPGGVTSMPPNMVSMPQSVAPTAHYMTAVPRSMSAMQNHGGQVMPPNSAAPQNYQMQDASQYAQNSLSPSQLPQGMSPMPHSIPAQQRMSPTPHQPQVPHSAMNVVPQSMAQTPQAIYHNNYSFQHAPPAAVPPVQVSQVAIVYSAPPCQQSASYTFTQPMTVASMPQHMLPGAQYSQSDSALHFGNQNLGFAAHQHPAAPPVAVARQQIGPTPQQLQPQFSMAANPVTPVSAQQIAQPAQSTGVAFTGYQAPGQIQPITGLGQNNHIGQMTPGAAFTGHQQSVHPSQSYQSQNLPNQAVGHTPPSSIAGQPYQVQAPFNRVVPGPHVPNLQNQYVSGPNAPQQRYPSNQGQTQLQNSYQFSGTGNTMTPPPQVSGAMTQQPGQYSQSGYGNQQTMPQNHMPNQQQSLNDPRMPHPPVQQTPNPSLQGARLPQVGQTYSSGQGQQGQPVSYGQPVSANQVQNQLPSNQGALYQAGVAVQGQQSFTPPVPYGQSGNSNQMQNQPPPDQGVASRTSVAGQGQQAFTPPVSYGQPVSGNQMRNHPPPNQGVAPQMSVAGQSPQVFTPPVSYGQPVSGHQMRNQLPPNQGVRQNPRLTTSQPSDLQRMPQQRMSVPPASILSNTSQQLNTPQMQQSNMALNNAPQLNMSQTHSTMQPSQPHQMYGTVPQGFTTVLQHSSPSHHSANTPGLVASQPNIPQHQTNASTEQGSYTFKSHPHPGQYMSTPSNESSPKHAPTQRSRQTSFDTPVQAVILTPTPVNEPKPAPPLLKQPSSDLAGLILTPTRNLSSSADELLFTSPDQGTMPVRNNNQVMLVPTKIDEESDKMVVRPIEGLPYMDEADLMKFKGQVTEFRSKVSNLLHKPESNGLCELDREWKQLSETQEKYSRQLSTAIARCSSYKNRYQDIVPFDKSRVVLKDSKDDYINASVIDGVSPYCPRFVATQSPLPNTTSDFWLMVYEQQVTLIVMLVNAKDVPKKCPMYWPADRTVPQQHGPLTVSFTTSKTHGDLYIERTFTIKHRNQSLALSVTQLQYMAWPEHRLPLSASDLLSFLSVVQSYHSSQRNLQWPVLVHCESGVGRTGVFCAFLAGVSEINASMGIMNVIEIVTKMRQKRKYMVQEKVQLKFVYDVILYHAIDVLKQRRVILEDEVKPSSTPQQAHQHQPPPVQTPSQFDIFSDQSALYSIQATVQKMTVKPETEKIQQPAALMSKSCGDIQNTNENSMYDQISLRPNTSEIYSTWDTTHPPQSSNSGGQSDLVQGTITAPVLHEIPTAKNESIPQMVVSKPDVVESCNTQNEPGKFIPILSEPVSEKSGSPVTLIESLTPETFTLETEEEASRKPRVTKEDFFKPRTGLNTEKDPTDPFSGLDPLWGLKK